MASQQVCAGAVNSGAGDIIKPPCNPLLINEDRTRPPRTASYLSTIWCVPCALEHRPTPAIVHIDHEPLCHAHLLEAGYEPSDGIEIVVRLPRIMPLTMCGDIPKRRPRDGKRDQPLKPYVAPPRAERKPRVRKPFELRPCVTCGKEFAPRAKTNLACSPQCSPYRQERMPQSLTPRPCIACGQSYQPTKPYQKFCNPKCWWSAYRKGAVVQHKPRKCVNERCQQPFIPKRIDQIYCTRQCSLRARSRKSARKHYPQRIERLRKR